MGWGLESRPGEDSQAAPKAFGGAAPILEDEPGAGYFRESFAVLVRGKTVRRHLYFNLPAAERAVKRARARGDRADMLLVQLVPVGGELR